jgi:hypothetical protein
VGDSLCLHVRGQRLFPKGRLGLFDSTKHCNLPDRESVAFGASMAEASQSAPEAQAPDLSDEVFSDPTKRSRVMVEVKTQRRAAEADVQLLANRLQHLRVSGQATARACV